MVVTQFNIYRRFIYSLVFETLVYFRLMCGLDFYYLANYLLQSEFINVSKQFVHKSMHYSKHSSQLLSSVFCSARMFINHTLG